MMGEIIKFTEEWVKLSNKEITGEWNLKEDIEQGTDSGYRTNERYKIIRSEVHMLKKLYDKSYKKKRRFIDTRSSSK